MSSDPLPDFPDPDTDYREHPERYRIGRGERGVLTVEPYKSELLPHWRFKDEESARTSSAAISALYESYREQEDFVGMDMARKFLQMGFTRARRYANHKSGRKYDAESGEALPREPDEEKARAAEIFREAWQKVLADERYIALKTAHKAQVERRGGAKK